MNNAWRQPLYLGTEEKGQIRLGFEWYPKDSAEINSGCRLSDLRDQIPQWQTIEASGQSL